MEVGPESQTANNGKSVAPTPNKAWTAKIIIMNPNNFTQKFSSASPNKNSFCEVRVKACDEKFWVVGLKMTGIGDGVRS